MDKKMEISEQISASRDNIMQDIQVMIGNLLKETVEKMQNNDIKQQFNEGAPDAPSNSADVGLSPQMEIADIKKFVDVMQLFIDNVRVMVTKLEGSDEAGDIDEKFLDGYMATADNVLEIAAFSMKDPVTGLSNRYGFHNRIRLEWNRAVREKRPLSLLIFNVNGFSDENNNPQLRDEIFKAIGKTLESTIKRSIDFLARWSDDEFAALLPITPQNGAMVVAERIRAEVENMVIPCIKEKGDTLSASIGLHFRPPESTEQLSDFISGAQNAFIKAKESGQCIVTFEG